MPMTELPTGTVTFLFTDIEGSTQLERQLRDRYGEVLGQHQAIVRAALAAHGGREIDTQGDSFFYVFPRAKAAVDAAVDAQRALAAHVWPEDGEVRVRMGVSTGEASLEDGRYVGFAVHRAARISAAGHGGQILLSSSTRDVVEADLGADLSIRNLGERRFKDLPRPERVYQLVGEGLPSEFAPLKTLDIELKRRRRRLYAGAALIGAFIAAIAMPVFTLGEGSGAARVEPNSVAAIDPESNRVVGSVPVGIRPAAVAVGEGSVWVANTEDETVSRIDSSTRELIRTISVGEYPSDVAVADGSAWVALGAATQLRRIVLDRNEAEEGFRATPAVEGEHTGGYLPCARSQTSLTAGGGALWLACVSPISAVSSDASRINLRTKRAIRVDEALVSSSPVGIAFSDIAVGLGSAWIANRLGNSVTQIDAATLRNVREVTVGSAPEAVAVGFGSVWVANQQDDTVSRLTIGGLTETLEPVVPIPIPVGDEPVDVAVGEDAVWIVNAGDRSVSRIDPATNEVVATIELENKPVRVADGDGHVWVTVQEPQERG
jgi:YVTN family beta-propeller protein